LADDGKFGFTLTLIALLVLCVTFASTALTGGSDQHLQVMAVSGFAAVVGHFFLGGGQYRRQMLEARRRKKDES
jgi:hypothetical protein